MKFPLKYTFLLFLLMLPTRALAEKKSFVDKNADEIFKSYLFIRSELDKSDYFTGENVVLQYVLFVHNEITLTEITEKEPPQFTDWWVKEEDFGTLKYDTINYHGEPFRKAVLRKYTLNALSRGKYIVPQFNLEVAAALEYSPDFPTDDNYYRRTLELTTQPQKVNLEDLPPAPDGFSDAIGEFHLSAHLNKSSVKVGESTELIVKISGEGNFFQLSPPELILPEGLSFDGKPEIRDSIIISSGVRGEKTYIYTITSEKPGEYLIGQLTFIYFSPNSGKYSSVSSEPLKLAVAEVEEHTAAEPKSTFRNFDWMKTLSISLFVIAIIILLFLLLSKVKFKRIIKSTENRRDFAQEIKVLQPDNDFLDNLTQILNDFLASKCGIPPSTQSESKYHILSTNDIPTYSAQKLKMLIDKLDKLRFSNTAVVIDTEWLRREALEIINDIENAAQS